MLERQDIDRKIQVADDCTLRQFIDTYVKGVEQTMETLHEIIGMDVPMRDCSRAYLNMTSQVSVLLPEVHKAFLNAMAKEERLWMEVIGRSVENGELQNDVQPFYGRAFQDSLINGMDPKLLKEEMLAVYEMIKR